MKTILFTLLILFSVQTDTLTSAYTDKWEGATETEGAFVEFMTSNDMIFVVLGVSLIIWFVLLFFLARTERKLAALEKSLKNP
jgi:hypothetical protein